MFRILAIISSFIVLVQSCSDSSSNCANWVANGFCKSPNYSYSQKKANCAQSCGFCGTTSTASGSATTDCQDNQATCGYWASNGFCTNPFYSKALKTQYKIDSTTDSTTTTACVDNIKYCSSWAARGYCTNSFYTDTQRKQFCAKTCSLCT
ncbi:unnamed protein product [Caenorhabditis angaria]|uniref:ShKT domain-containing protein n=1 Tax=Caenorhabditis angaria TaxID=860376 RepID=A0A9P1ICA7_9PELO|nr:unnamed protein product [Caenorhabditis angaria]